MSRKVETEVFQYDELSDSAQDKARDWYRNASEGDNFFADFIYDDAERIGEILGVTFDKRRNSKQPAIYWSGFYSQGDGASFEASYSYAKGAAKKIRAYAPDDSELHKLADRLQALQKRCFYGLSANISKSSSRYEHEMTMEADVCDSRDHDVTEDDSEELLDIMRDFARWIYRTLEKEYEYQNSDEQIAETIRANEYEFTEEGERF